MPDETDFQNDHKDLQILEKIFCFQVLFYFKKKTPYVVYVLVAAPNLSESSACFFFCFILKIFSVCSTYRIVNVGHLQQVFCAAVFLHLDGLPAPLHGYPAVFREVGIRGHLHVSALKDDLVEVIFVFSGKFKNVKVKLTS